jgi:hypothetical protein
MSIISNLRRYKESPYLAPLIASKRTLQRFGRSVSLDEMMYAPYEKFCELFAPKPLPELSIDRVREFKAKHVLVLTDVVPKNLLSRIVQSATCEYATGNTIKSDLLWNETPNAWRYFYDRLIRNLYLSYNFPETHLTNLSYIRNPIERIDGLRDAIRNSLLPITNSLMGTPSEVVRTWLYRTNNFGQQESRNHNGKMHLDGDRDASVKCIVYLNDVDSDNGPTCYRDVETGDEIAITGAAGTVIFFRSSLLWHKGTNTLKKERLCFSFLAHPAMKNSMHECDVRPNFVRKTIPFLPCDRNVLVR